MSDTNTLTEAAALIRENAECLRSCHATLDGDWLDEDAEVREHYEYEIGLAGELEALAGRHDPLLADLPIDGAGLIIAERARQIAVEGWSEEHDDAHNDGELAAAGAAYALNAADQIHPYSQGDGGNEQPFCWPWDGQWWKPKDPLRDLVRAGALIAAEIDRLLRVEAKHDRPEP